MDHSIEPNTFDDDSSNMNKFLKNVNIMVDLQGPQLEQFTIDSICRGCLELKDLTIMHDAVVEGIDVVKVYEMLTEAKLDTTFPAKMCSDCISSLSQTHTFLTMLKQSYIVIQKAVTEIKTLSMKTVNFDDYNVKIKSVLEKMLECKNNKKTLIGKVEESCFSDENTNSFLSIDENQSSDDEIPLLEKFKVDMEEAKKNLNRKIITIESFVNREDKNKEVVKKQKVLKEDVNNKGRSTTTLYNKGQSIAEKYISRESFVLSEICVLCEKEVKDYKAHLIKIHCLDWEQSMCLKCSYKNKDVIKLIEHSKECNFSNTPKRKEHKDNLSSGTSKNLKSELKLHICGCDLEFKSLDEYNEHIKKSKCKRKKNCVQEKQKKPKFICNKCGDVGCSNYKEIEVHFKQNHSSESSCILCSQKYNNCLSLVYHMMVKHGKLKCCRLCLVSFKNSDELMDHYKSEEHNTKCTVCHEQFKNRKALYEHRRKKHLNPQLENKKYKCPECPKEFANQNNIRRHISVSHNDVRFLCDTCGQSYTTNRNLQLHILKFHEGQQVETKNTKKNFFCEACGRELKIFHKYSIALHRAKHKGHNYVCKKCFESFGTEEEFNVHVQEQGHQLFECDKCPSQFVREENLKIHLKNHDAPGWNKNYFVKYGKSAQLRNEKGEFVCSYCPKVFKDKQRLDNHVRVHTNERPYKCHICQKGFKTWIHRKTHLNIHLGIKKWQCKYCQKAFTYSCTLKGHEMTHTGERPHKCPECKKGFIAMSAMKKHRQTHFRTGALNFDKKTYKIKNQEEKTDSDQEDNSEFMYKYDQIFVSNDVSYESFTEPPKDPHLGMSQISKNLPC